MQPSAEHNDGHTPSQRAHDADDGLYIGLMSGTSMDGVDGVIVDFTQGRPQVRAEAFVSLPPELRDALFALQSPADNEVHREARAANALAARYAACCHALLTRARVSAGDVRAIGVHGQTIRHRPELGYTRQINNPALLAELTGIDVVADFRSRDVAAGGHGAPLVPAFHAAMFAHEHETRVVCNLGGISNITILDPRRPVRGFDCGPANALLDHWAQRHLGKPFDENGQFAACGQVNDALLRALLDEPFFSTMPPKSTGRDLFNASWLQNRLSSFADVAPHDVQATLVALTAQTIAHDIEQHAGGCRVVYVCGGGTRNAVLLAALQTALRRISTAGARVETTNALDIAPHQVEALAFAWLAMRHVARLSGNLPTVTGAAGERVLGALHPR